MPGSPAIDAGSNALIPSGVITDQRGAGDPRIVNGTVDIGAFEFGGSTDESQTISFSALVNQTYGAPQVNLTATASSNLPVSFAIISGPATISGSVLTITGAGTVVVEASQDGNDVFAPAVSVDQSFTVNTATLTILPDAGQSKVYGAAVPGLTETATGFVNGDSSSLLTGALGTMATASSAVGTYAFTLGSLDAGPNYTLALAASPPTFAVTAAPLSIHPDTGQSKVYGAAVPGLTETATGFVNGDSSSLLTGALGTMATASSAVGTYAFTLGSLDAGPNYTLALAASPPTLAVTPAALSIQPNSGQSKVYGAAVPDLTETTTGFVNGDSSSLLTGALGTMATASSAVGTYAFTLGSLDAGPDYTLALADSPPTFAVTAAPLSIQPNSGQSKVYGAAVPGLTETATGFVNGDSSSLLTGALGTMATASSAVGTYAFTLGSLDAGPNYTLALAASPPTFAVTAAPLSIQPNSDQSKVYGAAVSGLTETATGFVNGDTDSLLTGAIGTVATANSAVGTYAFSLGSLSAGPNYTLAMAASPPSFTVTAAPLSIHPNTGQSKVYGAAVPGLTETATGFVNGDTASLLTGALGTAATASSAVGTYAFSLGSLSAGPNYTMALAASPPTFAVTPASLVVTANSASITSGQALPGFAASYAGFVNGDTSARLTTPPTLSTTAGASSPAGTYAITASGASSRNYTITYVPGTLSVALPLATVERVSIQKIKLSKHKAVQGIVLQFSEALDSADAQKLSAYTLATVPKKKQKSKPVALSRATYNSSALTVTLLTRKTLALNPPLDLTVRAASVLDALGRELDGNDSGGPGANFTAVLRKAGATVTSARIGGLSSHAVDAVLEAGLRRGR